MPPHEPSASLMLHDPTLSPPRRGLTEELDPDGAGTPLRTRSSAWNRPGQVPSAAEAAREATPELVDAKSQPVRAGVPDSPVSADHGSGVPAGEVVDVQRDETRQEDQLRRDHGQLGPWPQVEQRQPDPGEDRVRSTPPELWMNSAARRRCAESPGHQPTGARRRPRRWSTSSGGPPWKFAHVPSSRWARPDPARADDAVSSGVRCPGTRAAGDPRRPW